MQTMVEPANSCAAVWCGTSASSPGASEMPRYRFVVRHSAYADLEDDEASTELPDEAAAREPTCQR